MEIISKYIYVIIGFLLIISKMVDLSIKDERKKNIFNKFVLFNFFFVFIIGFTFRASSVGFDYRNYINIYDTASKLTFSYLLEKVSYIEPGYLLLNYIFSHLNVSIIGFQFIISIVFCFFIYRIIDEYSYDRLMMLYLMYCIGIFFNYMNQTRSCLAALLCLYAFVLYINNNKKMAIFFIASAISIHYSAIIAIPILILKKIHPKLNLKNIVLSLVIIIIVFVLYNQILSFALDLIPKYKGYFAVDKYSTFVRNGSISFFIIFVITGIFNYMNYKNVNENLKYENSIYYIGMWSNIIGIAISLLVTKLSLMQRFMTIPLFFIPIMISIGLDSIEEIRNKRLYRLLIMLFMFIFMIIYVYISEAGMGRDGIYPYTFWQGR